MLLSHSEIDDACVANFWVCLSSSWFQSLMISSTVFPLISDGISSGPDDCCCCCSCWCCCCPPIPSDDPLPKDCVGDEEKGAEACEAALELEALENEKDGCGCCCCCNCDSDCFSKPVLVSKPPKPKPEEKDDVLLPDICDAAELPGG